MKLAYELNEHNTQFCAICDHNVIFHSLMWTGQNTIKVTYCSECKCDEFKLDVAKAVHV